MCWIIRPFGFIKGNITSVPRLPPLFLSVINSLINCIQGHISPGFGNLGDSGSLTAGSWCLRVWEAGVGGGKRQQ